MSGWAVMMYYDMTMAEVPPAWTFYYGALCIFLYQTFDAVDGKQARRTGTSGPLGQLFDHGCDAMVCTLACGIFFQAQLVGRDKSLLTMFFYYFTSHVSINHTILIQLL